MRQATQVAEHFTLGHVYTKDEPGLPDEIAHQTAPPPVADSRDTIVSDLLIVWNEIECRHTAGYLYTGELKLLAPVLRALARAA